MAGTQPASGNSIALLNRNTTLNTKEGPNQHHQGIRLGPQRRDYLSSAAKRRYKSTISPAKSRKVMAFIMWSCE